MNDIDNETMRRILDAALEQFEAREESFADNPDLFETEANQAAAIEQALSDLEIVKGLLTDLAVA